MANDKEIDQCLALLETVYPNHFRAWTSIEQMRVARQVYHRVWRDIDGALLESATLQWLSTKRPFHPSPGELRDLALSLVERSNGDKSADEAWLEVIEAMRKVGSYRVPAWSSWRIEKTVRAFGWKELCATDNEQMPFIRSQFMNIYKAMIEREHDGNLTLPEVKKTLSMLAESKRITSLCEPGEMLK